MSKILVIDDQYENARLAAKLLRNAGYDVSIASDGETGLAAIREYQPDLVLADLGLPDMDGQTMLSVVRHQLNLPNLPMVAYTAWPENIAHDMAKAYGFDGVIVKPIDTRSFAIEIAAYFKSPSTSETE